MILYTNKAPIINGVGPVMCNGKFDSSHENEEIIPEGHVFKVLFVDQAYVFLTSKRYDCVVNPEMLSVMFTESSIEV